MPFVALMTSVGIVGTILLRDRIGHGLASALCSIYLLCAMGGIGMAIMLLMRGNGWGILLLFFDCAFAAWAVKVTHDVQSEWHRESSRARARTANRMDKLRATGGTCPRCNGTGLERVDAMTRFMVAYGGALASYYGAPVSSRQMLKEFETACFVCKGKRELPEHDAPADTPSATSA